MEGGIHGNARSTSFFLGYILGSRRNRHESERWESIMRESINHKNQSSLIQLLRDMFSERQETVKADCIEFSMLGLSSKVQVYNASQLHICFFETGSHICFNIAPYLLHICFFEYQSSERTGIMAQKVFQHSLTTSTIDKLSQKRPIPTWTTGK